MCLLLFSTAHSTTKIIIHECNGQCIQHTYVCFYTQYNISCTPHTQLFAMISCIIKVKTKQKLNIDVRARFSSIFFCAFNCNNKAHTHKNIAVYLNVHTTNALRIFSFSRSRCAVCTLVSLNNLIS